MTDPELIVLAGPAEVVTAATDAPGSLAVGPLDAVTLAAETTDVRLGVAAGDDVSLATAHDIVVMELASPAEPELLVLQAVAGGGSGSAYYAHVQAAPAAVWVIAHGLGKCPSVTTVDSSGRTVYGDVYYTAPNVVTVVFGAAFSGAAYCN